MTPLNVVLKSLADGILNKRLFNVCLSQVTLEKKQWWWYLGTQHQHRHLSEQKWNGLSMHNQPTNHADRKNLQWVTSTKLLRCPKRMTTASLQLQQWCHQTHESSALLAGAGTSQRSFPWLFSVSVCLLLWCIAVKGSGKKCSMCLILHLEWSLWWCWLHQQL